MIEAQFIVNEEIFSSVRAFISEQAGVPETKVRPESRLYEDLGIDGHDARP